MAHAPTRRPKNYPDRRRPQRGPRPVAGSIRARLASATAKLKEAGAYDEAAAIESVTGPRGYLLLRRTEEGETSPLSLTVPASLKQALLSAAEEFDLVLDALAEDAYRKFLKGSFVPPQTHQVGRGKASTRSVLQVQIDSALRQEVQEKLPEVRAALGYKERGLTESSIILTYVCDELGVELASTAKAESLDMRFPKAVVRHWKQRADEAGLSLERIVEERIPSLLDGSWVPERSSYMTTSERGPRTGSWSESDRQRLWLPIDKELLSGLRGKAEDLSENTGVLVYPGTIVRAILTDRLGEPAE